MLEGRNPWAYPGSFFSSLPKKNYGFIRTEIAYKFFGFRCALALVANKLFDNPYSILSFESDFQGDTNKIGYAVLGMYILGNCMNLKDHAHKYDTILFYARDGYLTKRAFDLFKSTFQLKIRSEYCYSSRKSLIPLFISKKEDLYSLIEYFGRHESIEDVLKILSVISNYDFNQSLDISKKHIDFDISTRIGWTKFITFFANELFSQEKVNQYHQRAQKYFSKVCVGKCASFDVGYSFRTDYLLNTVYGFDVTPYVIHAKDEYPFMRASNANMKWHSILPFHPMVTGQFREACVSEIGPSCVGYDENGYPILEDFIADYPACLELASLHEAAEEFVKDYLAAFADIFDLMRVRYFDLCFPFEVFSTSARIHDREWTNCIFFENALGAFIQGDSLFDTWNKHIKAANDATEAMPPKVITASIDPLKKRRKLRKKFIDHNKFFIKYYYYKLFSKLTSGKLRKKMLSRMAFYEKLIIQST